ncbi:mechanosensitive ion channel domain-containing protein [uncultured Microscilla sp.]|uniref:mechanosensitive ion channel family protein n=1 Tax=uncultured Microscilla sp. TaxID=432653 RepID=UPI00260DF441|nr:mechanosensitive ion channel domain-containing protein [uncultured Microscilla sp.]
MEKYLNQFYSMSVEYAPKILLAIATLIIGLQVVKFAAKLFKASLKKQEMDETVKTFLTRLVKFALKAALFISVATIVGVKTSSFIAMLGAAGLAIGLALQGSLSNFAGGVVILVVRPFSVGDFITAQGNSGTVKEIRLFCTILKTPDNKTIYIPNGGLANASIVNVSIEPQRRVDLTFGIGYDDDVSKAKSVLKRLIEEDERILTDRKPFLAVSELADSSVNFVMRVWVKKSDYWGVHFDMKEKVKVTFDKEGISIPYPHQEVYMHQVNDQA